MKRRELIKVVKGLSPKKQAFLLELLKDEIKSGLTDYERIMRRPHPRKLRDKDGSLIPSDLI